MSLLRPGSHRVAALVDDAAVAGAMLAVEAAWSRVLGHHGADGAGPTPTDLLEESESAGNPVVPLVRALRATVEDPTGARAGGRP